ncbi:tetratricopeptide repeat protein [Bradyrhizobium yuanmingense]|uniref:tetratricopeptide repeat protein n=1 Tax=Bradyrhizobium yuanmingense TaxID=108015 RepID=UPI0023B933AA|nr:tetratricopeptide repeat protein [Bradyrhizobium yuanmingense]MDF0583775.1 tetratricopeptide repeat protein [Bradyrhizobium yuanmingense]
MADLDSRATGLQPKVLGEEHSKRLAELHALALDHLQEGKLLKAQSAAKEAFKLDGDDPATLHLMAVVSVQGGQWDHAVEWASRAIRKDPQPVYLATLGRALLNASRLDEALRVFDKAVQLKPSDAELWQQMGDALIQARRNSDALLCFRRAFELDSGHADAAYKAGHLLHGAGQLAEALAYLNHSVSLLPDNAQLLHTRALVLNGLGRIEEATADCRRAVQLDPKNADTLGNLGALLRAQGHLEEALSFFDRSLKIKPNAGKAIVGRASVLADLGRVEEAMSAYKRSAAILSEHSRSVWNLALLQMLTGDFKRGLKGMQARWDVPGLPNGYPPLPGPKWLGDGEIAGKTILVCADEGLGDAIQLVRYIPLLASRGARVVLIVQDALRPLLSNMEGVSECLPGSSGARLPPFDLHCPLSNLPLIFGTRLETIPAAVSYLPLPSQERVQAWESRLGPRARRRVGLVWSGNPEHLNDHNRSIPFHMLTGLLDDRVSFVSLQKDVRPNDRAELLARTDIFDAAQHLTDFAETAALISCLDLVITVDTSVAHLSAALGKPTWILLPFMPDYRWLLNREDSPWYPTARLFRQTHAREYASVVRRVSEALAGWLDKAI